MSDDLHFKDLKSRMERFKIAKRHLNIVFFIFYIYIYIHLQTQITQFLTIFMFFHCALQLITIKLQLGYFEKVKHY